MEDFHQSLQAPGKLPSAAPGNLGEAIETVSRHALKTGLGGTSGEQAAFSAAWSATQVRLLLSYMERHAATAERSFTSLTGGELKQALGIVLKDAADRCAVLSRDLDLARGETLGAPPGESAERTGMAHRVRRGKAQAAAASRHSL